MALSGFLFTITIHPYRFRTTTFIIEQITSQKTLLINSPPINQARLSARKKAFPQSNFVATETLEQYVQVANKVANCTGSHFLDLWSKMQLQPNCSKFLKLKDGVHLNQQGYEFFASILVKKIQSIEY